MLDRVETLQASEEAAAQPLLDQALAVKAQRIRDQQLNQIIIRYPHTDVAIEAMQLLGGNITK